MPRAKSNRSNQKKRGFLLGRRLRVQWPALLAMISVVAASGLAVTNFSLADSLALMPTGDTYIEDQPANANFGSSNLVEVNRYTKRGLMRFATAASLPSGATLTGALLKLYVVRYTGKETGLLQVHPELPNWSEASATWANQPDWNGHVVASGHPQQGRWLTIKLPATAINLAGDMSLGLRTNQGMTIVWFSSREDETNPPQLLLQYRPAASMSPTPLPTSTPSGSPGLQPSPPVTPASPGPTPIAPSAPTHLSATILSDTSVALRWDRPAIGLVSRYIVIRNGLVIASMAVGAQVTSNYTDATALPGASYTYRIRAYDSYGDQSPRSNVVAVTMPKTPTPDTQPPSAPSGLTASLVGTNQVDLSWEASTDNVGVASYLVYESNTKIATVPAPTTSFGAASLADGTSYTFYVQAEDASGNVSAPSNTVAITTGGGGSSADPSGVPAPRGNLAGWKQLFVDDFAQSVPLGAFSGCSSVETPAQAYCSGLKKYPHYYADWWAYPAGWPDTAKSGADGNKGAPFGGTYQPEKAVSVSGGEMHIHMYRPMTGTDNVVATVVPRPCMDHEYGRYTERFRVSHADPGFKSAHLFYQGGYEIDYPENDYGSVIYAYTHPGGAAFDSRAKWTSWHTTTIEWTASSVKFYMDGRLIGTTTARVPHLKMDWILQNESSILGPYAKRGAWAQLDIDWVSCYAQG